MGTPTDAKTAAKVISRSDGFMIESLLRSSLLVDLAALAALLTLKVADASAVSAGQPRIAGLAIGIVEGIFAKACLEAIAVSIINVISLVPEIVTAGCRCG